MCSHFTHPSSEIGQVVVPASCRNTLDIALEHFSRGVNGLGPLPLALDRPPSLPMLSGGPPREPELLRPPTMLLEPLRVGLSFNQASNTLRVSSSHFNLQAPTLAAAAPATWFTCCSPPPAHQPRHASASLRGAARRCSSAVGAALAPMSMLRRPCKSNTAS